MVEAAIDLNDLKVPPSNRLEILKGKMKTKHSIKINDQYQIAFRWKDQGAEEVQITDYH